MAQAKIDGNRVKIIIAVSSINLTTPVVVAVNPVNNAVIVELG